MIPQFALQTGRQPGVQEELQQGSSPEPAEIKDEGGHLLSSGCLNENVSRKQQPPPDESKMQFSLFLFCSAFAKAPPASVAVEVSLHLTALEQLLHFSFP